MQTGTRVNKNVTMTVKDKYNNTASPVCGVIQRSFDYSCNVFLLNT